MEVFKEIDDIKLAYNKAGTGKALILLHGWGQNKEMMQAIENYFVSYFSVYNLDLPGFGESADPPRSYSVEDYAIFLRHFIEAENIDNPIIVAHSFGCRIALHYADHFPVHKLVLTGAAGIRDKRNIKWYFKTYSYKLAKKILTLPFLKKYYSTLQKNVGSIDYKNSSGVMRETFVKVVNDDVLPFLKDIKCETLLIFGEFDEATPLSKGKMMEKIMPNATLIVFKNDDHYAYFHQAMRFNKVLEAFLKDDYS